MHIQRQADSFAYRMAASLPTEDELSGLQKEFDDWWDAIPEDKRPRPDGNCAWNFNNSPITSWENVEKFLSEHYPQAHSGAEWSEDAIGSAMGKNYPDYVRPVSDQRTLANMIMLHRRSQGLGLPNRGAWTPDEAALYSTPGMAEAIVKGRNKMQRAYDQAHVAIRLAHNTIRCAADDDLILYHGTGADSVPHIQQNGLMHPPGVSPAGWPMLTTDFDQAKAYATRDNPVVLEYHVPANLTYGRWRTHRSGEEPYLWDAEPHTAYDYPAQSYALKRPLPATFLRAVHPVQRKLASRNTIHCATSIPSLTDTWKDFVDWAGGNEDEAYVGAQWWPNLEQYLADRHGLSNNFQYTEDKDEYYSHPMVLQMGKIHALAHSREDVTPDISEDEKLEAAAMGLINLRKRVDQQRQNLIDDPNSPYYYDPGEWV